jgi:hypothetical protein
MPFLSLCNILSERMGQSFTIVVGPRQRSHSRVGVPRDSWPYFTVSDSRLPHPGGPGSRIYIPLEQGGPVISPGKIMRMNMFAELDKVKPDTENLRGLNLAVVKLTTVQVTRVPL